MLIIIDGPDGTGKTTLCKALTARLRERRQMATYIKAPSPSTKAYLLETGTEQRSRRATDIMIGSLITLGDMIRTTLGFVVVDRWVTSLLVYQDVEAHELFALCKALPPPDLGVRLTLPDAVRQARLASRSTDAWDGFDSNHDHAFKQAFHRLGLNQCLDTSKPLDDCVDAILRVIDT